MAGHFGRALSACVFKARVVPDVVRTDRGPEMRSKVVEEFPALRKAKHLKGAAYTPQHKGLGERGHQ
eukprot:7463108-Alexandrium_andersonii.AAC.1